MKTRFVVLIAVASIALGVGLGSSMQAKSNERPRAQVTHRMIDTTTLSHFLDCYCHDISIQKDAIATYTTCELQVLRPNKPGETVWKANNLESDEDGLYRVVVMMKPSDRSKNFNTSPSIDVYCNGMTQGIDNPFLGLLKEKGIAILKYSKLNEGRLILFERGGKTEADPKVTIQLAFN